MRSVNSCKSDTLHLLGYDIKFFYKFFYFNTNFADFIELLFPCKPALLLSIPSVSHQKLIPFYGRDWTSWASGIL